MTFRAARNGNTAAIRSYTYDGKQLVTTVDAAPDPGRFGTKQPRGVRFENGLMILIPPPRVVDGVTEHREIAWEKVSDFDRLVVHKWAVGDPNGPGVP